MPKESLVSCSYFMIPQTGSYCPQPCTPDLCLSPVPQELDSDDEWQHLLEASKPTPVQLKAPLTLLCNPDFCQHIQRQLHEAGGQVMGRRIPWRGLETVFTDKTLKNIDWHKEKEEVCPFPVFFQFICLIHGDLLTSFSNTERTGLGFLSLKGKAFIQSRNHQTF